MVINQYEIWWINLDPTVGAEIQKVRPCVVVSPNEMNHSIRTVLIAPMTSSSRDLPTRIPAQFDDKEGWIILDQLRCVDKTRMFRKGGELLPENIRKVKQVLHEMLVE